MITFENLNGGIGMRAVYGVIRDGEHVASMRRYSTRWGWEITSVHYDVKLGGGADIDAAKQRARELVYPTKQEVYEQVCERTAVARRTHIEGRDARKLAQLVRDMIAGSNSARAEIDELVAEWDRFAADRSDTYSAAQARYQAHNESLGEDWRYNPERRFAMSQSHYPYYPEPPVS